MTIRCGGTLADALLLGGIDDGVTIRCGGMLSRNAMRAGVFADVLLLDGIDDGVDIWRGRTLARKAMGGGATGGGNNFAWESLTKVEDISPILVT
ncbi:hypothetical protein [Corynebacterium auriscanis]|uniref:hypothetical protein n=1 Tax=Corynebacterium auriscanis TaxID=99807 RepID=UPI0012EBD010|nr:hypothetical protein [Corynebacterium auriscanis]